MHGTYEDLKVWRLAMDLVLEVYCTTSSFPKHEIYGLTSQMRRAAVSIPVISPRARGVFRAKNYYSFYTMREDLCWNFRPKSLSRASSDF